MECAGRGWSLGESTGKQGWAEKVLRAKGHRRGGGCRAGAWWRKVRSRRGGQGRDLLPGPERRSWGTETGRGRKALVGSSGEQQSQSQPLQGRGTLSDGQGRCSARRGREGRGSNRGAGKAAGLATGLSNSVQLQNAPRPILNNHFHKNKKPKMQINLKSKTKYGHISVYIKTPALGQCSVEIQAPCLHQTLSLALPILPALQGKQTAPLQK